jgi:hypothetical protein
VRARREKPRRSERRRDPDFLARVHGLSCFAAATVEGHRCEGPIEADHAGHRPLGRKCHDDEAIPLCRRAHRERTDFSGAFKSWKKARMRAWLDYAIQSTRLSVTIARGRDLASSGEAKPPS